MLGYRYLEADMWSRGGKICTTTRSVPTERRTPGVWVRPVGGDWERKKKTEKRNEQRSILILKDEINSEALFS
jgi:hypothetical protein